MTNYIKNDDTFAPGGYIFIEQPHRGPRKVWYVFDDADLIKTGAAIAERSRADLSGFDMASVDGIIDYVRHDLSALQIVRFKDIDDECLTDPNSDFAKAMVALEWAVETEE
jgi:hypothetical protein